MIRGDDDQGAIQPAGRAQIVEQPADHRVRVGDFGVVRREARRVRFRRTIRIVGIVQMHPCEERRSIRGCRLYPCGGRLDHIFGSPLGGVPALLAVPIVVHVEAARETEARVEDERPDKRAGAVPGGFQHGREGRKRRPEPEQSIRAHAVHRRRNGGENRRVGRQRQRRGRVRPRQRNPVRGEPIERRGQPRRSAECSDTVAAKRVNRDQQNIAAGARAGPDRRLRRAPDEPAGNENQRDGGGDRRKTGFRAAPGPRRTTHSSTCHADDEVPFGVTP